MQFSGARTPPSPAKYSLLPSFHPRTLPSAASDRSSASDGAPSSVFRNTTSSTVLSAHSENLSLLIGFVKDTDSVFTVLLPLSCRIILTAGIAMARITAAARTALSAGDNSFDFGGGVSVIVVLPIAVSRSLSSSSMSFMRFAGFSSSPCCSTAFRTSGMPAGYSTVSPSILSIASGRSFPVMHQ